MNWQDSAGSFVSIYKSAKAGNTRGNWLISSNSHENWHWTLAASSGHVSFDLEGTRVQPLPMSSRSDQDQMKPDPIAIDITLSQRLGLHEFFSLDVWRASIGEVLGSAVLVFMIDTIVISTFESDVIMPNLIMSILIAILVTILLLAVFPVSGGHINPVISFSAALVGLISLSRAIIYIMAQCVGAVIGALALKAVVSSTIENNFSLGGCTLTVIAPGPNGPMTTGIEASQAFWLEIFCSFILLFSSVWMVYDHRQAKKLGLVLVMSIIGTIVGLLVFVSTTVTARKGYAGAGMNPARCLGAAIVRGGHLWDGHWIFWVGPTISCFGFYFYTQIIPDDHFHAEGYKHDFFEVLKALVELKSKHK